MSVVRALYVTVWDDSTRIQSACMFDTVKKLVSKIDVTHRVDDIEILTEEFVERMDGEIIRSFRTDESRWVINGVAVDDTDNLFEISEGDSDETVSALNPEVPQIYVNILGKIDVKISLDADALNVKIFSRNESMLDELGGCHVKFAELEPQDLKLYNKR